MSTATWNTPMKTHSHRYVCMYLQGITEIHTCPHMACFPPVLYNKIHLTPICLNIWLKMGCFKQWTTMKRRVFLPTTILQPIISGVILHCFCHHLSFLLEQPNLPSLLPTWVQPRGGPASLCPPRNPASTALFVRVAPGVLTD